MKRRMKKWRKKWVWWVWTLKNEKSRSINNEHRVTALSICCCCFLLFILLRVVFLFPSSGIVLVSVLFPSWLFHIRIVSRSAPCLLHSIFLFTYSGFFFRVLFNALLSCMHTIQWACISFIRFAGIFSMRQRWWCCWSYAEPCSDTHFFFLS